jgi:hypothetical protein
VTPTDRPAALAAAGLDACVPDAVLADLLAERGGGDALTLRRGLALWRARELLVDLAVWDRPRCVACGGKVDGHWARGECDTLRFGPTRPEVARALGLALRDAGDVRAASCRLADDLSEEWAVAEVVDQLTWSPCCPRCGAGWLTAMAQDDPAHPSCPKDTCGWSGPAGGLLPPLLARAELDAAVAARRATTGLASGPGAG